jgi:hypothetical protein
MQSSLPDRQGVREPGNINCCTVADGPEMAQWSWTIR